MTSAAQKDVAKKGKTEKAIAIAALELLLIVVGFVATLPTAFLVAFVVIVYVFTASFFSGSNQLRLSFVQRTPKDRISDIEDLVVEETIRNEGSRPLFLEILTSLPDELVVNQGSNHYIVYLRGKETRRIRYQTRPLFPGHFMIPNTKIRTMNFFLASLDEKIQRSETTVSAYPVLEELRRFPTGRISMRPLHGVIPSRSPGPGTEFFEIREYSSTDDFRRINWKASARTGTLLSNEYEWERIADIYVIIDSTASTTLFLKDYIRVCITISDYFLRMGNRVGLVAIGEFWTWVRSGSGRKQLVRLADNLIDTRPKNPNVYSYQIESTMRAIQPSSTIIFLSPLRNNEMRELVRKMAERRQRVVAIIPAYDGSNLEASKSDSKWKSNAKMLVKLERENAYAFLKKLGIEAIQWDPELPLSKTVEAFARWSARRPILMA